MSDEARVGVRGGGPGRCAYCHDAVVAEDRVACNGCLAVHHGECWRHDGCCAACGATASLVPQVALVSLPRDPSRTENAEARSAAMLCHLAALAGLVVPFGQVLGPLIAWQMKKAVHPFVDQQGRASLNFQLTISIVQLLGACVCFSMFLSLAVSTPGKYDAPPAPFFYVLPFWGLLMLIGFGSLGLAGYAAWRASQGESFRYPFAIRFIREAARPVRPEEKG
jgi:uncharacterized Tic20 family protein